MSEAIEKLLSITLSKYFSVHIDTFEVLQHDPSYSVGAFLNQVIKGSYKP